MILAMLGLPGAGKSTLARALGDLTGAHVLLEPDEDAWPPFVLSPHTKGAFTRLSWFRSQRAPLYYDAAAHSARGHAVILDSYYDKWCVGWLGKPGLEWLIAPDDPYMPAAKLMAATDAAELPAADVVILLELDEEHWQEQLRSRDRTIDRHGLFVQSHGSQQHFIETALARGPLDGTTVVRHRRERATPQDEAKSIVSKLNSAGIYFTALA